MLHRRHATIDISFVFPQNHGSWKFENGYLCMFLVCRQVLDRRHIHWQTFSLGATEILCDEVELQRVTGIHVCIWSSIVSKLHS